MSIDQHVRAVQSVVSNDCATGASTVEANLLITPAASRRVPNQNHLQSHNENIPLNVIRTSYQHHITSCYTSCNCRHLCHQNSLDRDGQGTCYLAIEIGGVPRYPTVSLVFKVCKHLCSLCSCGQQSSRCCKRCRPQLETLEQRETHRNTSNSNGIIMNIDNLDESCKEKTNGNSIVLECFGSTVTTVQLCQSCGASRTYLQSI